MEMWGALDGLEKSIVWELWWAYEGDARSIGWGGKVGRSEDGEMLGALDEGEFEM